MSILDERWGDAKLTVEMDAPAAPSLTSWHCPDPTTQIWASHQCLLGLPPCTRGRATLRYPRCQPLPLTPQQRLESPPHPWRRNTVRRRLVPNAMPGDLQPSNRSMLRARPAQSSPSSKPLAACRTSKRNPTRELVCRTGPMPPKSNIST